MLHNLKIEKYLKKSIFISLLALIIVIFSQKIEFTSIDLGRHLENGKIVWQDSRVLFQNFYSYTETNNQFINHHWLAGIIYYFFYQLGGFKLLSLLNIIIILSAFTLAFKLAREKAGFYISTLLSIPIIFLLSERVEIRPEIFSYFFIILTWFILDRAESRKKYHLLIWLIPLFIFWVNIHIYFFIGLGLVGFKAVAKFLSIFIETQNNLKGRLFKAWEASRVWLINLGYLFLVCAINPNFIRGLFYPFNILKNYGYDIAENKSIFFLSHLIINHNFLIFKILLFLLVFSFLAAFIFSKKINWFEFLASLFFSTMALLAVRNISIFGLVALIVISTNLTQVLEFLKNNLSYLRLELRNKYQVYLATIIFILILGQIIYLLFDSKNNNYFIKNAYGWGLAQGSEESINFFRENGLSGPIFNNYDLGSALIFWLYPEEKVFVDNRPEAYGNNFFSEIYRPMQLEKDKWRKYSAQYNFKVIYFSHTDSTPWAQKFLSETLDETWRLVYFDSYTVIFLNAKNNGESLINKLVLNDQMIRERIRSLALNSSYKNKMQLASFASLIRKPDLAEEIYQDILFTNPDNGLVLSAQGTLYANSQNRAELLKAKDYFRRALETKYKLPWVYNQKGLVNWKLTDYVAAENDWRATLKLERKNVSALYYLEQIRQLRLQGQLK